MSAPETETTDSPAPEQPRGLDVQQLFILYQGTRPGATPEQFKETVGHIFHNVLGINVFCLWLFQDDKLQPGVQHGLAEAGLAPDTPAWSSHLNLLTRVVKHGRPGAIGPHAGPSEDALNPLHADLLLVPISVDNQPRMLVEVICQPLEDGDQARQRFQLFLKVCEFIQDFVVGRELKGISRTAQTEREVRALDKLLLTAGSTTDLAYRLVNDTRTWIGCDRITVVRMNGRKPQVVAVTGQDTIESRSQLVRSLRFLAQAAARTGEVFHHSFTEAGGEAKAITNKSLSEPASKLYQSAVSLYPAEPRPKRMSVIPIRKLPTVAEMRAAKEAQADPKKKKRDLPVMIVVILEDFQAANPWDQVLKRFSTLADSFAFGWQRTLELDAVPRFMKRRRIQASTFGTRKLRRAAMWLVLFATLGGLAFVPWDFRLAADGKLMAEHQRVIFAPEDGVVRAVEVKHGESVKAGAPLVVLENLDLNARLRENSGELTRTRERLRSLEAKRNDRTMTPAQQIDLQGQILDAQSTVAHFERINEVLQERVDRLKVPAAIDGMVVSWNLSETLLNRPVRRGDGLLTQIDPTDGWQLEVRIPEDRVGYVQQAIAALPEGEQLAVDYLLTTDTTRRYTGRVKELAPRTELIDGQHAVFARITPDKPYPPLRHGAEVKVRFLCGKRPAGFVWLRELIEVFQTYAWF